MHYVDKPTSITAEGVTIGREKGVAFGCELTQIAAWPPRRAAAALDALTRAELDSKRSVLPQETVAREALFTIARAARR